MALWVVRAGSQGEHEQRFLETNRVYATWEDLTRDLAACTSQEELRAVLEEVYSDWPKKRVINYASQLWPFAHEMQPGDWIVVPSKKKAAIHIGEIVGPYTYVASAEDPYYHQRQVKWIEQDIPRSRFDQDLLHTFGAFMTICRATRNDAEPRVRAMAKNGWHSTLPAPAIATTTGDAPAGYEDAFDLERIGRDQIAKVISQRFRGDDLERLVEALLEAQGYTTYRSPKGADHGVDILAAPGALGFGRPRICVQVKSQDSPVGREVLDQLVGTMQHVQAEQGLLVSWGGFRSTVDRETPAQFFRVRLWDQDAIIDELLAQYDHLDAELRAELPLKRVWTVAMPEDSEG